MARRDDKTQIFPDRIAASGNGPNHTSASGKVMGWPITAARWKQLHHPHTAPPPPPGIEKQVRQLLFPIGKCDCKFVIVRLYNHCNHTIIQCSYLIWASVLLHCCYCWNWGNVAMRQCGKGPGPAAVANGHRPVFSDNLFFRISHPSLYCYYTILPLYYITSIINAILQYCNHARWQLLHCIEKEKRSIRSRRWFLLIRFCFSVSYRWKIFRFNLE